MAANNGTGDASRFRNGLPANATDADKKLFATHCIQNYKDQNWHDGSLSEYFADDFRDNLVDDLSALHTDLRRNLQDLLRQRGVYVPKGRNVVSAKALHQIIQEEPPWPDEDPAKPPSTSHHEDSLLTSKNRFETKGETSKALNSNRKSKAVLLTNDTSKTLPLCTGRPGQMANLFKAYGNDSDKYSGSTTDNFERKYMLFLERCDQVDITEEDRHRAFSIMLIGNARQYYFDSLKPCNLNLKGLEDAMKSRFQTPERTRALIREWDTLTLNKLIASNPTKTHSESLELLIGKLSDIQTSLPSDYRNETIMKNKLLNAIRDVESCRLAYHKPADTVQGVISDLHASLSTAKKDILKLSEPSEHLVHRRYIRNCNTIKPRHPGRINNCFVCKRPVCSSTNHPPSERLKSYRNSKSMRKFMASLDLRDDSENEEEETADAVEDVIAHMIDLCRNEEEDEELSKIHDAFSHIATIDEEDASASFTAQLQDTILSHTVTLQFPHKSFGDRFDGVMVDTGASRGSSAGRDQYQAYCTAVGLQPSIDTARAARCHFGTGSALSLGTASVSFPVGNIWLSFPVHVVDADTPNLLSIDDMDRLGVYLNNLKDVLVHSKIGMEAPITRVRGHPFVQ